MNTIHKYLAEDLGSHSAEEFEDCSVAFVICSDPLKLQLELYSFLLPSERSSSKNVGDHHIRDGLFLFDAV